MVARLLPLVLLVSVGLAGTACGSGSGPAQPTISAAKTYRLENFTPAGPVWAGRPTRVGLTILQPSGAPLTRFRTGAGPHVGIDLLIVPATLESLMYVDPPIAKDGSIHQDVTFAVAGRYRIVVDSFPAMPSVPPNVQLFTTIEVQGKPAPPATAFGHTTVVGGYTFSILGSPRLKAVQPSFLMIRVTDRRGRPVRFQPLDGALAHAIFFRTGSLDYFHTHVCTPSIAGCASASSGIPVGSSTQRGVLRAGVLLPLSGTWRLFLRTKIGGVELVTPFTLRVAG